MSEIAKPKFDLEKFMPPCPLMRMAWADCLLWAIGFHPILAQFEKDTGVKYRAPRGGLEMMIDEATGANAALAEKFITWFNENIWGDINESVEILDAPENPAEKKP